MKSRRNSCSLTDTLIQKGLQGWQLKTMAFPSLSLEKQLAAGPKPRRSQRSSEPIEVTPASAVEPPLATATEHFAVHEDTALQPCEDEMELPVHDSWWMISGWQPSPNRFGWIDLHFFGRNQPNSPCTKHRGPSLHSYPRAHLSRGSGATSHTKAGAE